jgi:hypothetical protein
MTRGMPTVLEENSVDTDYVDSRLCCRGFDGERLNPAQNERFPTESGSTSSADRSCVNAALGSRRDQASQAGRPSRLSLVIARTNRGWGGCSSGLASAVQSVLFRKIVREEFTTSDLS